MRRHTRLHMNGPKERKPEELNGEGEYLVFVLMILTHSHMHCGQGSDIPASTKSRHPFRWTRVVIVSLRCYLRPPRVTHWPCIQHKFSFQQSSPLGRVASFPTENQLLGCFHPVHIIYLYFLPSVEPSFPFFDYSTSGMIIKPIWLGIQRIIVIMTLSIILFVVYTPCLG